MLALWKIWKTLLGSKSISVVFWHFGAHTNNELISLWIFLKICKYRLCITNIFYDTVNYLLSCIQSSAKFHIMVNHITIDSSSQARILNHLHLLPIPSVPQPCFKSYWLCLWSTFAPLSAHCLCFNLISSYQKIAQLTKKLP